MTTEPCGAAVGTRGRMIQGQQFTGCSCTSPTARTLLCVCRARASAKETPTCHHCMDARHSHLVNRVQLPFLTTLLTSHQFEGTQSKLSAVCGLPAPRLPTAHFRISQANSEARGIVAKSPNCTPDRLPQADHEECSRTVLSGIRCSTKSAAQPVS